MDLELAAPATGPVNQVWYSADGSTLYARTGSGKVFRTSDFETWSPAANPGDAAVPAQVTAARLPEPGAIILAANSGSSRIFALGRQLWGSGDGGQTWLSLTAYKAAAVVGPGQHSVAVSPNDEQQIVLANDFGVWRSMDGGLSWDGLNQGLPNLRVVRILSTPSGTAGTRVETDPLTGHPLGALMLPPGGSVWEPVPAREVVAESSAMANYSRQLGATITALGAAGNTIYVGAANGRIWVSEDAGQDFRPVTPEGASSKVKRIFVDPVEPRVALAVMDGTGPRVLRTTSTGTLWDPMDGNLPDAPVNGITADRAAGAMYVATGKGVFYAHADLENPSIDPAGVVWTNLSDRLPSGPASAAANDVRLDPTGVQLYAALEGYGVYATPAPHRTRTLRIVNTADYSTRAAAPGSLLSVVGGRVNSATDGSLNYPVLAAADTESQIQVPFEAVGPNVDLRLETATGTFTRGVAVQPVSPAILVGRDGVPMLWDADSGLPVDAHNTAHSNGRLQIWATGLGKVHPDWPTGLPAPMENPPAVAAPVGVFLDGVPLQVTKATLVPGYIGFYLVEVQLPTINNLGPSELYITAGGQDSNRVQVILEP
ncbi:MAG TPA: hypothetical protein VME43_22990 [Bryobacteraceae bacterium]|nr:hypothetical protein [Bryobacteraceae bacterium]